MDEKDLTVAPSNLSFTDTLRELQSGNTKIPVDPTYIEPLRQAGVLNTRSSSEAYIEKLFAERKQKALEIDKQLGEAPLLPDFPQAALCNEMRECMTFGLNGAAITLGALLVESTIKTAIARKLVGVTGPYPAKMSEEAYNAEMERLETKAFSKAIEEAFVIGIISEELRGRLHSFRAKIRNPYLHYNLRKLTAGVKMTNVKTLDAKTGETKYMDIDLSKQSGAWHIGKKFVDEQMVSSVYLFAIEIASLFFGPKDA